MVASFIFLFFLEFLTLVTRYFACCQHILTRVGAVWTVAPCNVASSLAMDQVTARVSNPAPLKLPSFDGLVDHSCMEDQEKKGGILSKVGHPLEFD